MGCSDKAEIPPPLPLKGNADYGNLFDNQDLTSPSTPPPPPPHQRVGVLIRAECNSLMMHSTWNETSVQYSHLTFISTSFAIPSHSIPTCLFLSTHVQLLPLNLVFFSFSVSYVTEERRHQSVSSPSTLPLFMPALPEGLVLRRD